MLEHQERNKEKEFVKNDGDVRDLLDLMSS
jgi:hypothetical protein